jgi:hypothetical protein
MAQQREEILRQLPPINNPQQSPMFIDQNSKFVNYSIIKHGLNDGTLYTLPKNVRVVMPCKPHALYKTTTNLARFWASTYLLGNSGDLNNLIKTLIRPNKETQFGPEKVTDIWEYCVFQAILKVIIKYMIYFLQKQNDKKILLMY